MSQKTVSPHKRVGSGDETNRGISQKHITLHNSLHTYQPLPNRAGLYRVLIEETVTIYS